MSQSGPASSTGSGGLIVETLTGNSGGAIGPNASFNIDLVGNTTMGVTVVGNAGLNTLTIIPSQSTTTQFGVVKLATNTQAIAGTDTQNALTSDDLTAKLGPQTAFAPICGGTAAGTALQSATTGFGTPGFVLTSTGSGSLPTWQANSPTMNIAGDSGIATGNTITFNGLPQAGSSVSFSASAATVLLNTSDSRNNTIIGNLAGNSTLTATGNVGIGCDVLPKLTTSPTNVAIGFGSCFNLTAGAGSNVAIGSSTLTGLTTGAGNIVIGSASGTGLSLTDSNNILIGNTGVAGDNLKIKIGTQGSHSAAFMAGITGVTVANQVPVYINSSTGQLGVGSGAIALNYTPVNNGISPYVVTASDNYLGVDVSGGVVIIKLPNAPVTGRTFTVKDKTGGALANNITVTTVGGVVLIDGAAILLQHPMRYL